MVKNLELTLKVPKIRDSTVVNPTHGAAERVVEFDGPFPIQTQFVLNEYGLIGLESHPVTSPDLPWPRDLGDVAVRLGVRAFPPYEVPWFLGIWLALVIVALRRQGEQRRLLFASATAYLLLAAAVFVHPDNFDSLDLTKTHIALSWTLLALSVTAAVAVSHRLKRPGPAGRCTYCGYELRGNRSGRCPECGMPVSQALPTVA